MIVTSCDCKNPLNWPGRVPCSQVFGPAKAGGRTPVGKSPSVVDMNHDVFGSTMTDRWFDRRASAKTLVSRSGREPHGASRTGFGSTWSAGCRCSIPTASTTQTGMRSQAPISIRHRSSACSAAGDSEAGLMITDDHSSVGSRGDARTMLTAPSVITRNPMRRPDPASVTAQPD